jgi:hypothetical protein
LPFICCSIYNNITQLDIPTRRRQAATETPDSTEHQQQPPPEPDNGVPVYVMLPLDTVWLLERDGRKYSVSLETLQPAWLPASSPCMDSLLLYNPAGSAPEPQTTSDAQP